MSLIVQGTNDSCTVSKAAMVKKGYFKDIYVKNFVANISNRSPIINRGYFIRAFSIQNAVAGLLREAKCGERGIEQVISMGAGFDTTYFRLRDAGLTKNLIKYVEVDVANVMDRKMKMLKKHNLLKNSCESDDVVYEVLQEDMKHTHKMFQKLIPLAHPHYVTLVLCEVSLVYLPFVVSDRILKVFADVYQKSICLLYEQVNTKDPFGRFMVKHFKKLDCPLGSPGEYSSLDCVTSRMAGRFPKVVTVDLNHITVQILPKKELKRVNTLEPFDEYEEFFQLNSHYTLTLLGTKEVELPDLFPKLSGLKCQCCFPKSLLQYRKKLPKISSSRHYEIALNFFKHVSVLIKTRLFIVGGFGAKVVPKGTPEEPHGRLKLLADIDIKDKSPDAFKCVKSSCWERLNAAMLKCGNLLIVFGGRKSPTKALNDMVRVQMSEQSFGSIEHITSDEWDLNPPSPRYRMACGAIMMNYGEIEEFLFFIDGGKTGEQSFDDGFVYHPELNSWEMVQYFDQKLPPRHSHSICNLKDCAFLLSGGIFNNIETDVSSKLYLLEFKGSDHCNVELFCENILPVFGHTSHVYVDPDDSSKKWLVLVGGIGFISGYSLLQILDLNKRELVRLFRIHDCLVINHTSHLFHHHLLIVGGGGNLFSFGTYFNESIKVYSLTEMLNDDNDNVEASKTTYENLQNDVSRGAISPAGDDDTVTYADKGGL